MGNIKSLLKPNQHDKTVEEIAKQTVEQTDNTTETSKDAQIKSETKPILTVFYDKICMELLSAGFIREIHSNCYQYGIMGLSIPKEIFALTLVFSLETKNNIYILVGCRSLTKRYPWTELKYFDINQNQIKYQPNPINPKITPKNNAHPL
eukprot:475242_1